MDILVTEDIESPAIDNLGHRYGVVRDGSLWKQPEKLQTTLQSARTVIIRNQTRLTKELLEQAPQLIGIGRHGVGLDNIDMETASRLGIVVIAPLGANATSVAEHTLGLLLALCRK